MKTKDKQPTEIKILLIENDLPMVELIEDRLISNTLFPAKVHIAENLSEAKKILEKERIDIVLTDLNLPDSQGISTLLKIREKAPEIPVVVLSGTEDPNLREAAIEAGAVDFLQKGGIGEYIVPLLQSAIIRNQEKKRFISFYERLLNDSPDAKIVLDAKNRIVFFNKAAHLLFGNRAEIGGEFGTFFPEQDVYTELAVTKPDGTIALCDVVTYNTVWKGEPVRVISFRDLTEHKKLEEELARKEKQYRQLVESLTEGLSILDTEGRFIFANPAAHKIAGVEDGQLVGRNLNEFLDETGREIIRAETMKRAKGITSSYELEIIRADKQRRILRVTSSPWYNEEGKVKGSCTLFVDITKIKNAEKSLRENEARLREVQQIARIGHWEYDIVNDVLTWSDIIFDIFEVKKEDFTGNLNFVLSRVHPEDRESVEKTYWQSVEERADSSHVHRILTPDGAIKYVHERWKTYYAGDGTPLRTVGTIQDVTELKRTEEKLQKIQERFLKLVDRLHDIVWTARMDGSNLEINNATKDIYGVPKEEFQTNPQIWLELVHPDDRAIAEESVKKLMAEGYSEVEYRILRPDGEIRWLRDRKSILFDDKGDPVEMGGIASDISEIKKKEEEKIQIERQLIQAQKMEAVGQLAGGIAHDFNNMLSIILGRAQLAMMKVKKDDPSYRAFAEIYKAGKRAAEMPRKLLAFARKDTVAPRVINLNKIITQMLKMVKQLIGEDIEVIWNPGENLWNVKIDPSQVDQILVNLAVNARDAIGGVGTITIDTKNVKIKQNTSSGYPDNIAQGEYVMITFTDTGSGMDRETLRKIFDPFFTTKDVGKGTGLGLSTVYGIIKQNGGYITVDSTPSVGTTFRIFIPRYKGEEQETINGEQETLPRGHGETILIVEDDPQVLENTSIMLENLGYKVLSAGNPNEALRIFRERHAQIDLLFTDIIMPDMNGLQLSKEVEKINPNVSVVFMSGYTADILDERGFLQEGLHFIEKPLTISKLATTINDALSGVKEQ